MKKVLPYLIAAFMLLGVFGHIFSPEGYSPFIPEFIPHSLAHIFAIVTEAAVAIALLIPKYRKWGGLGFMILMLIFLPLHVWDLFREDPAMGSMTGAIIRVLVQFLLIFIGWWIWKKSK